MASPPLLQPPDGARVHVFSDVDEVFAWASEQVHHG